MIIQMYYENCGDRNAIMKRRSTRHVSEITAIASPRMLQLQNRKQTFKRSCYRRQDKDYLAEMYLLGVLYSLYMMSCGSFPIKYDSHRGS